MSKKIIGIVGWVMGAGFGTTLPYMEFFSRFGDVVIINPNERETRKLDLLVLPGGPDVDVARYLTDEESLSMFIKKPCPFREWFDATLLPLYIEQETPIFGICRGHQSLAVEFGGHLNQHMFHETNPVHDRAKKVHKIDLHRPTLVKFGLEDAWNMFYEVNSIHHQVIDRIPKNTIPIASYKGLFNAENEALAYLEYPAFTVQWHPEELGDCALSNQMIELLLDNKYLDNLPTLAKEFANETMVELA
jgi:putative glutamine amidotransferase